VNIGEKKFFMCAMFIVKFVNVTQGIDDTKKIFSRDSSFGH